MFRPHLEVKNAKAYVNNGFDWGNDVFDEFTEVRGNLRGNLSCVVMQLKRPAFCRCRCQVLSVRVHQVCV